MKWIKASERLPEKQGLVHFKNTYGLNDVVFYNDKLGFHKPKIVGYEGEGFKRKPKMEYEPLKYSLEEIYWLDESPTPVEQEDEEILKQYETYVSEKGNPIFLKENALKAMAAARKDEREKVDVGFAEWIAKNQWKRQRTKINNGLWYVPSAGYGGGVPLMYTTAELYAIYLNQ